MVELVQRREEIPPYSHREQNGLCHLGKCGLLGGQGRLPFASPLTKFICIILSLLQFIEL
jgi:hypothetical protein